MTDEYDGLPRPSLLQQRPAAPETIEVEANVLDDNRDEARQPSELSDDDHESDR